MAVFNGFGEIIEKQFREAQTRAENAERTEKEMETQLMSDTANTIVANQQMIGNMRIMDEDSEKCLEILLSLYDGNEGFSVDFQSDDFPLHIQNSMKLSFEKLKRFGVILRYSIWITGGGEAILSSSGLNYFKNKEIVQNEKEHPKNATKKYDVFISHANKDKLDYVDKLVDGIKQLGIRIFYDKDEISWGDNWKGKILNGTKQSEFAIIVISENFFGREWTEKELTEFLNRQNESGQKIILPLLYNITFDDVAREYPQLENIQGLIAGNYIVEEIVILLAKELIKRYKGE